VRLVVLTTAIVLAGCAATAVRFPNATPGAPRQIPAVELRPPGAGPFPALVLLHGCHGVLPSTREWGRWFRARGYVALIVDSLTPRGLTESCSFSSPDIANTERFDDTVGAFSYLASRPYVDRERIGVIGWSNGGVSSMGVINGPSVERARLRGVLFPGPGFRAAVAFYPGGCPSLVNETVVRPLLVLIGDADDWTVPEPCIEMVHGMRSRGADVSLVVYPGALHDFDVEGPARVVLPDVANRNRLGGCCGATIGYDPAAAADARGRVEEFLASHLGR
jgi:dienelactone hydrolase